MCFFFCIILKPNKEEKTLTYYKNSYIILLEPNKEEKERRYYYMKILKFYMCCGVIQSLTIEEVMGCAWDYRDKPRVSGIRLEKHGQCFGNYREDPWTYSKFLSSMGMAMNNWLSIHSTTDLYFHWENYVSYCINCNMQPVDDLLESILECPLYAEENFLKVIYNTGNDGMFDLEDYKELKDKDGGIDNIIQTYI